MSLYAHALVPRRKLCNSTTQEDAFTRHSLFSSSSSITPQMPNQKQRLVMVQAKKWIPPPRQPRPVGPRPVVPTIENDGNPRFVIFIRMANVYLWFPVSIVTGGSTAKLMVAAKDNFLGKYIYKDTLARNIAAVIYKDEKKIRKEARSMHRVLRSAKEFRYGYKLVENNNVKAAIENKNVIELPQESELKTVLDKVKDFFGEAKESFGKLTDLGSTTTTESEEKFQGQKLNVKTTKKKN